jgi:hypothetical protein
MRVNGWTASLLGLLPLAGALWAQSPSREYIRLGGRVIAIESPVVNAPPAVVSLSPMSGSGNAGDFTGVHSDANGATDIRQTEIQVLPVENGSPATGCVARYNADTGRLELLNDAGILPQSTVLTPGQAGSVSNSRCTLHGPGSAVTPSGDNLTVTYSLAFAAGFGGSRSVELSVTDRAEASASLAQTGTWTIPDTAPPQITSGPTATPGEITAAITWQTDEPADSQVEYGTTTAYGSQTILDPTLVTNHAQTLTGLAAYTTYHYRVKSRDGSGNLTVSGDYTFVTAAPACTIHPTSATAPNGGGSGAVSVTCPAGYPWTATVDGGTAWLTLDPGSGNGPGTVNYTVANAAGAPQRTATASIAGQTFTLTQLGASSVTVTPETVTLGSNQTVQFHASVNGGSNDCTVNWSLVGVGSISVCGLYTAPAVILPGQTVVTVEATDPVGNGSDTASITLLEYAPPGGMAVSPNSGSALSQLFTLTVEDVHGAAAIERVEFLIHTTDTGTADACYLRISESEYPPYNAVELGVNSGSGWADGSPVTLGTPGVILENSQCRLNVGNSSLTLAGNTMTVRLDLYFKPGFIGFKKLYMKADNTAGAGTYWAQVGTWDLTANPAALPPKMELTAPAAGATVSGMVAVSGWALDNDVRVENAITKAEVYIDGELKGNATLNQPSTACNTYPGRSGCPNVGFLYYWNTGEVMNGPHTVRVVVTDYDNPGHTAEVSRTVMVNNLTSLPVVVTPNSIDLRLTYTSMPPLLDRKDFTAYVGGVESNAVDWSVVAVPPLFDSPMNKGVITALGLYTPPNMSYATAGNQVNVKAVRQEYPSDWGQALVTLMGWLNPHAMTMSGGQTARFLSSLGDIHYTLSPGLGTIDTYGNYTAPMSYTPGTVVTITGTNVANPIQKQQALVTLQ